MYNKKQTYRSLFVCAPLCVVARLCLSAAYLRELVRPSWFGEKKDKAWQGDDGPKVMKIVIGCDLPLGLFGGAALAIPFRIKRCV